MRRHFRGKVARYGPDLFGGDPRVYENRIKKVSPTMKGEVSPHPLPFGYPDLSHCPVKLPGNDFRFNRLVGEGGEKNE